jgi:uncharacterized protein (TIGR00661 family)
LRPEILSAQVSRGEHLLVYQTAEGYDGLPAALQQLGMECRIYGFRRDLEQEVVEHNLRYRPFSEAGFIEDLASARAVISGGGFTLMGEAVFLHKPMLAVPVGGQFEQSLNARYLHRLGYGRHAKSLADPAELRAFVAALPFHEKRSRRIIRTANRELLAFLDAKLQQLGS